MADKKIKLPPGAELVEPNQQMALPPGAELVDAAPPQSELDRKREILQQNIAQYPQPKPLSGWDAIRMTAPNIGGVDPKTAVDTTEGVVNSLKGLVTAPIELGKKMLFPNTGSAMGDAAMRIPGIALADMMFVDPIRQSTKKMIETRDEGMLSHIGTTLEGIPLVGPIGKTISAGFEEGKPAKGFSQVVSDFMLPVGLGKGVKRIVGKPSVTPTTLDVAGTEIPLSTGEALGSPNALSLQKTLRNTNAEVLKFEQARQAQLGQAMQGQIDQLPGGQPYAAGNAAKTQATQAIKKTVANAQKPYQELFKTTAESGINVPLEPLRKLANEISAQLDSTLVRNPQQAQAAAQWVERIKNMEGDSIPFEDMHAQRSNALYLARKMSGGKVAGRGKGYADSASLAKSIDNAMEQSLIDSGRPDLVMDWRKANQGYADAMPITDKKSALSLVMKSKPETVHKLLPKLSVDEINLLKSKVPTNVVDSMIKNYLSEAIDKATPETNAGLASPATNSLQAKTLQPSLTIGGQVRAALKSLGKERLEALTTDAKGNARPVKQILTNVNDIAGVMDTLEKGGGLQGKMQSLTESMGYHAPLPLRIPMVSKLLAKVVLNPEKVQSFKNFLKTAPGTTAEMIALQRFNEKPDPSIAEALGLNQTQPPPPSLPPTE